jgi:hypothetical protein
MTRVDNNQQILALFQKQLGKLAKTKQKTLDRSSRNNNARADGVGSVQKIILNPELEEADIHRALVQGILADAFGNSIMNDARFQEIVAKTTKIIRTDKETHELLKTVVAELENMNIDDSRG